MINAKNKLNIRDTAKNRLRSIEVLVSGDCAMDAEWYSHFSRRLKSLSREKLEEMLVEFGKIITNCHTVSHGYNSKCCKGQGKEIMDSLLRF